MLMSIVRFVENNFSSVCMLYAGVCLRQSHLECVYYIFATPVICMEGRGPGGINLTYRGNLYSKGTCKWYLCAETGRGVRDSVYVHFRTHCLVPLAFFSIASQQAKDRMAFYIPLTDFLYYTLDFEPLLWVSGPSRLDWHAATTDLRGPCDLKVLGTCHPPPTPEKFSEQKQ